MRQAKSEVVRTSKGASVCKPPRVPNCQGFYSQGFDGGNASNRFSWNPRRHGVVGIAGADNATQRKTTRGHYRRANYRYEDADLIRRTTVSSQASGVCQAEGTGSPDESTSLAFL